MNLRESAAQERMWAPPLFLSKHSPSVYFRGGDGRVSKLHVGVFSLCGVKMCARVCVCVLAQASRISMILWENCAVAGTWKVSLQS